MDNHFCQKLTGCVPARKRGRERQTDRETFCDVSPSSILHRMNIDIMRPYTAMFHKKMLYSIAKAGKD